MAPALLRDRVTFILGDVLDERIWRQLPAIDAAFLDPDWAIIGPAHVHRFIPSSTRPPAHALRERVLRRTANIALILPPEIHVSEFAGLPAHKLQRLYLGAGHELYCLYFRDLAEHVGGTELRV